MRIVADTSVFIAVAMNEPEKRWVVEATRESEAVAPFSLSFEIANAISRLVRRKLLSTDHAQAVWNEAHRIPVSLRSIDLEGALRLSCAEGIYAYDGFMLQCALEISAPLLTLDRSLGHVARRLGIDVLE